MFSTLPTALGTRFLNCTNRQSPTWRPVACWLLLLVHSLRSEVQCVNLVLEQQDTRNIFFFLSLFHTRFGYSFACTAEAQIFEITSSKSYQIFCIFSKNGKMLCFRDHSHLFEGHYLPSLFYFGFKYFASLYHWLISLIFLSAPRRVG